MVKEWQKKQASHFPHCCTADFGPHRSVNESAVEQPENCQTSLHLPASLPVAQEMYAAQTAALLEMAEWPQREVATREAEAAWAKLQKMAEER